MQCRQCRTDNPKDAVYCFHCGGKLPRSRRLVISIILIILTAVVIYGGFYIGGRISPNKGPSLKGPGKVAVPTKASTQLEQQLPNATSGPEAGKPEHQAKQLPTKQVKKRGQERTSTIEVPRPKKTLADDHGHGREKFLILAGQKVSRERLLEFQKRLESQGLSLKDFTTPEEWKKVQDVLGEEKDAEETEKETEKAERDNITQTKKESRLTTSARKPPVKYGYIVITSQPSGAKVYIDDTYKGHTPTRTIKLPTGAHVVSLRMSGYLPWSATVNVSSDKTVELTRELIQEP